jgi:hypothetical protein
LKDINKSFLEEYMAEELGKENEIGTINNQLRAMRVILNRAVGEKELSSDKTHLIKTDRKKNG